MSEAPNRFVEPESAERNSLPNHIDLHCHTDRSDGVLAPLQLYSAMRTCGLTLAAISDHDTLAGYRELAELGLGRTASDAGPLLVAAVEINSVADAELLAMGVQLEEGELHILGFGVDADDADFEQRLAGQRDGRRRRILMMVDSLRTLGYPIDEQIAPALATEEAVGRPHVARALVGAGYVSSVDEAFSTLIDRNGPAYVPRQGLSTRAALDAIRAAGGLPVLAHYPVAPEQPALLDLLATWGLAGLEVYYRRFEPETVARMEHLAAERALVATGGSDYHGDTMTYAQAQETTHVPDAVGEALLAALSSTRAAAR